MKLTEHEIRVLKMADGSEPFVWGAWVGACLGFLAGGGYLTRGPNYNITQKGREFLDSHKTEG